MPASEQCIALLEDNLRYAPDFGNRLSNHLSMALVALEKMGAPPSQLEAFADSYVKNLEPIPERRRAANMDSPDRHLGEADRFGDYVDFFTFRVGEVGNEPVVRGWVPILLPGMSGAGFHGMIRTAYAIMTKLPDEIATALAYWASAYQFLGNLGQATDEGCADVVKRHFETGVFRRRSKGIIADRMLQVGRSTTFRKMGMQPSK